MGYDTGVSGSLTITPPLSKSDIEHLQAGMADYIFDFRSAGEEDTVGWVDGEIKVIPGKKVTLMAWEGDAIRDTDTFLSDAQAVVKKILALSHRVEGSFYFSGEDHGDLWRARFDGKKKMVEEKPKLVWPNGDEEQL